MAVFPSSASGGDNLRSCSHPRPRFITARGQHEGDSHHSYPFASGEMSTFHMPQPALELSGFLQPICWPSSILLTRTHTALQQVGIWLS